MGAEGAGRQGQRVEVTVGLRDEQTERLEITRGVAAGDLLLVGAAQGMTPGHAAAGQAPGRRRRTERGATGMSISDFAIKRPIVTIVMMVAISVFGIFALLRLNTDEFPEVSPPIVSVSIPYPGASPDTVEREVVNPIEEQIASISGVKQIQSNSLDSFGVITVEFYFSKNLQEATQDIRDGISQIRNDLPQEMEEPILTRFDPNDFPIVQLALTSPTLTGPELTRIVDPGVTNQLRGVSGVAEVRVVGGIERELTVELDPQALQATGVGIGEVVQALQTQNLAAPVGRINEPLDRAHHPAARPPRQAGRFRPAGRGPARRAPDPARRHRRRQGRRRGAAHVGPVQRPRRGRRRHHQGRRRQHHRRQRPDPREGRRHQGVAAARRRVRGRPRHRPARHQLGRRRAERAGRRRRC